MDFDLAQVRAFLAAADLCHFGRAAARLHLTQQALSKRIQRLEHLLGEPLFARDSRTVELTEAGARFLPHARALILVADNAVADTRSVIRPVRVDVWGQLQPPLRWMRRLSTTEPRLTIEVSMRRSVSAAMDALLRGEIDLAFGRVHDLTRPMPDQLRHRLVLLGAAGALMSLRHPLARAECVHPEDLRDTGIWVPADGSAAELTGYYQRFAKHFDIALRVDGSNLGAEHAIHYVLDKPNEVIVTSLDLPVPSESGARVVPLTEPVPRWPWSLVWRQEEHNPAVDILLRQLFALSRTEGWTAFDPVRDWLPDIDLAELRRQAGGRS